MRATTEKLTGSICLTIFLIAVPALRFETPAGINRQLMTQADPSRHGGRSSPEEAHPKLPAPAGIGWTRST